MQFERFRENCPMNLADMKRYHGRRRYCGDSRGEGFVRILFRCWHRRGASVHSPSLPQEIVRLDPNHRPLRPDNTASRSHYEGTEKLSRSPSTS
ncbi:hypothetical protein B0T12DRAFT_418088 [Alternaria alternata]|nr:hypothetical protein B0T12DRAFT_418088 [Alternaria alternata]